MKRKQKDDLVIFRDAPGYLGLKESDFLWALNKYRVHEQIMEGKAVFSASQLRVLREKIDAEGMRAPRPTTGKVYIAKPKHGRSFKVGFSSNPRRRLGELQTGHHGRLELLHQEDGNRALEKSVHAAIAQYRQEGEWFTLNDLTRAFIDAAKAFGFRAALGANLGQIASHL
jgi:T5orf172 domain